MFAVSPNQQLLFYCSIKMQHPMAGQSDRDGTFRISRQEAQEREKRIVCHEKDIRLTMPEGAGERNS